LAKDPPEPELARHQATLTRLITSTGQDDRRQQALDEPSGLEQDR
jgi:hypothetical protein